MLALLITIIEVIWFFLPAGVANAAPVFAARFNWLPSLNHPLDGGARWQGSRILGDHKTIRGFIVGIFFGLLTGFIQYLLYRFEVIRVISLVSYDSALTAALTGAWLGFGGLLGDAIKSFLKRRRGTAPGKPWRPFDQIDLIVGALLVSWWIVPLTIMHVVLSLIVTYVISLSTSYIGVQWRLKKSV